MAHVFAYRCRQVHLLCADDLYDGSGHLVFLNGLILGLHRKPQRLLTTMRQLRRAGHLGEFVSIQLHPSHRCVNIASDSGRVCRPLIIVEAGVSKLKEHHMAEIAEGRRVWDDFVREGVIEYLDVNEENSAEIAGRHLTCPSHHHPITRPPGQPISPSAQHPSTPSPRRPSPHRPIR